MLTVFIKNQAGAEDEGVKDLRFWQGGSYNAGPWNLSWVRRKLNLCVLRGAGTGNIQTTVAKRLVSVRRQ